MRSFTSIDKAHYQPGEPELVSEKEISAFEQTEPRLRERASPALKPGKAYVAQCYFKEDIIHHHGGWR
jgi:hypothetical protein